MLDHKAAHRMANQHRLGANRAGGGLDVIHVIGEGCAGEIALAGAVAAQRQGVGWIAAIGEKTEKMLPDPGAAVSAMDEKHRRKPGLVLGQRS